MNYKLLSLLFCLSSAHTVFTKYEHDNSIQNPEKIEQQKIQDKEEIIEQPSMFTEQYQTVCQRLKRITVQQVLGIGITLFSLYFTYKTIQMISMSTTVITDIPEPIQSTIKAFGYKVSDFTMYECPELGTNAYVLPWKSIVIGSPLLHQDFPSHTLRFIIGHEIGHYYLKHALKSILLSLSYTFGRIAFNKYVQYAKKKYNLIDNPYLYRFGKCCEKMKDFLDTNPYILQLCMMMHISALQRAHEKEADLISAQVTGQARGGIDFFNFLHSHAEEPSFFSPFLQLFSTHPEHDTRVKYLTETLQITE